MKDKKTAPEVAARPALAWPVVEKARRFGQRAYENMG
jgi:hypothetical protein